jgi:2-polyprenyl-3-methyl-5-hydroxy-6-metoxy-1,4-benzoquinol methylase
MSDKEIAHLESINAFYQKGDHMDRLMIERELEIIARYRREGASALEIGCGDGFSTERLLPLFPGMEVVEPSKKNIELLRRRLPDIPVHNQLLEDYQTDKRYDLIFFLNVIEHVEEPVEALAQIITLMRDEGLVFITAPNCMSLNRRAGFRMGLLPTYEQMAPKDYEVGHRRLYTVEMLAEHCELAGLKILEMKGLYLKPLSERQMIDLGDSAIRAFYGLGEDLPHYCASLLAIATKKYY